MSSPEQRRSALVRFVLGAAIFVGFGCAVAAVDLWGGPRALGISPRLLGMVLVAGFALVVSGAIGWVGSWPAELRGRRALQAVATLAALGAFAGGGLFWHYAARLPVSREICRRAECATGRVQRASLLAEGMGPLFPVIDPDFSCITLERERQALERDRTCPTVLLDDAPCRCDQEPWVPTHPKRCTTGRRTTCEWRPTDAASTTGGSTGAMSIGCASDSVAERIGTCEP